MIRERFDNVGNNDLNDTNNVNGNKLRVYRMYKTKVKTEKYLKIQLPRRVLFRSGSLPLAIETGRYARPRITVENGLRQFYDDL